MPETDTPCMRCGGDLLDHLLCAGPEGGPDEYRCLRDLAQDVLHDMQTSEPADDGDRVDPAWVEVFEALATAHARSLISHEGPVVVTGNDEIDRAGMLAALGRVMSSADAVIDAIDDAERREQHNSGVLCPCCRERPRSSGSDPICAICRASHGDEWDGGGTLHTRERHMADMAAITDDVAAEGGPLGAPTVFAVLRDIADNEPLWPAPGHGGVRCTMCGGRPARPQDSASLVEHLISCPWQRAVEIVGVRPTETITLTATLTGGDAESHAAARDIITETLGKGPLVDAVIICGQDHPVIRGRHCDRPEGHTGDHHSSEIQWKQRTGG